METMNGMLTLFKRSHSMNFIIYSLLVIIALLRIAWIFVQPQSLLSLNWQRKRMEFKEFEIYLIFKVDLQKKRKIC